MPTPAPAESGAAGIEAAVKGLLVGGTACSALRIVRLVGGMAGSLSIFRNGACQ